MQVLGLASSPRRGGNTESLLDVALAELAGAGHQVDKVRLCDLKIAPCEAHPGCRKRPGGCVVQDDFPALADRAQDADAVITMAQQSKRVLKMRLAKYRHGQDGGTFYVEFAPNTGRMVEVSGDVAKDIIDEDLAEAGSSGLKNFSIQ